jgi:predicted TIM-barrel fold metal-dependent hydrolase
VSLPFRETCYDDPVKIDIFNHIIPPKYFTEFDKFTSQLKDMGTRHRIPSMANLDERFRVMDEFGDYRQVTSLASPPLETIAGSDITPQLATLANDGMAELCQKYPDRFAGFAAALPMNNPDAAVKELERSATALGALGAQLYSNVNG